MIDTNETDCVFLFGGDLRREANGVWRSSGPSDRGECGEPEGGMLRVDAVAILARKDPTLRIIASGGKGRLLGVADAQTVASVMKRELEERGVSSSRIIEEAATNNTYEQLRACSTVLSRFGWKRIMLISNRYHLPRIRALIKHGPALRKLRERYRLRQLVLLGAEDVLLEQGRKKWKTIIRTAYASPSLKALIRKEKEGVKEITTGKYRYS